MKVLSIRSLLLAFATVFLISSCDDPDEMQNNPVSGGGKPNGGILEDSASVVTMGDQHNAGVQYLMDNYNYLTANSPFTEISNMMPGLRSYFKAQYGEVDSLYLAQTITQSFVYDMISNHVDMAEWDSVMTNTFIADSVSLRERELIADAKAILTKNYSSLRNQQIHDTIEVQVNGLIATWGGITWDSTEGDMAGGVLYTIKGCNDFWFDYRDENLNPLDGDIQANIITIDASGFLVGWAKAAYDEYSQNGRLDVSNSKKRLLAGRDSAISSSFCGLFD